jgi:hypothetical protein
MMAKVQNAGKSFEVWVAETAVYLDQPYVTLYRATRLGPTGMTVANNGRGHPQIIPAAGGRRFFRDHAALLKYCRTHMEKRLQYHQRHAKQLGEQLKRDGLGLAVSKHGSAMAQE